jgi:Domain of unknown function (DUF222)/HNH endonuclease
VHEPVERDDDELIREIDQLHAAISRAHRHLFELIAEADRREVWWEYGARDLAHWLSMRYDISQWKARRWIAAAHALRDLPGITGAFRSGRLGIDKVVELARFATAETEERLIAWAEGVSGSCVRRRGDREVSAAIDATREADKSRFVTWWYADEGRRLGLQAELPVAQGAVVVRALDRVAESLPVMPREDEPCFADERRADALVALCSARLAADPDADRATVIVHAPIAALVDDGGGCEIEGGGVLDRETARRLLCNGRMQVVFEDDAGQPMRLGRMSREPTAAMMRQLRYLDSECRFPGCGARQFTQAHHIVWWARGGSTDLDNLLLVCLFHHKLVHEYGWAVQRDPNGDVRWYRPNGSRYHAGPAPPLEELRGA